MNHKYFQPIFWSLTIFLSSCNYQQLTQNLPEMLNLKQIYISISNAAVPQDINQLEQSVFAQINQYRKSQSLPPLQWDNTIAQQAKIHAQQMANGETTFSHDGFQQRVEIIKQKIPYGGGAENIAQNMGYSNPGEVAVEGWIKSPGHHQNIVGDYDLTGIGIAQNSQGTYYLNQLFIKTRASLNININQLEKSVFAQINQYRKSQSLPPLKWDNTIAQQAKIHAQQMANGETTFSHDGFQQRVEIVKQKIPYQGAGENIANNLGYNNPGEVAVEGWIKSPGHHQNIVGNYDLTGIGIAQNSEGTYYLNQLFIKTR
ncbi:CAP domain-containing protein [Okeania sp.]|uniref:CAP domain-containing protein n=1 Tax=Okeania sp. TaxID=3100323 RepID=UPI002B4B81E5|nr:CAP domain-containing protein [Okeania sp.]MEB3341193.1 CAP domain-containing protein [Okeania sp.]